MVARSPKPSSHRDLRSVIRTNSAKTTSATRRSSCNALAFIRPRTSRSMSNRRNSNNLPLLLLLLLQPHQSHLQLQPRVSQNHPQHHLQANSPLSQRLEEARLPPSLPHPNLKVHQVKAHHLSLSLSLSLNHRLQSHLVVLQNLLHLQHPLHQSHPLEEAHRQQNLLHLSPNLLQEVARSLHLSLSLSLSLLLNPSPQHRPNKLLLSHPNHLPPNHPSHLLHSHPSRSPLSPLSFPLQVLVTPACLTSLSLPSG